jgi:hypothetical protein
MISHDSYSPYDLRTPQPQKQQMAEDSIAVKEFQVERKTVRMALKENARGRFLRITESVGSNYSSIIIPERGFGDFAKALEELMLAAEANRQASTGTHGA